MREAMLIVHFIGLAMMVGTSIGFVFLGRQASRLGKEEGLKFSVNASAMGTVAHIGITLSILSGGYLMTPYWKTLPSRPMLIAKLALVVVLLVFLALTAVNAGKAKRGEPEQINKNGSLGPIILLMSLAIIVLAVLVFH